MPFQKSDTRSLRVELVLPSSRVNIRVSGKSEAWDGPPGAATRHPLAIQSKSALAEP